MDAVKTILMGCGALALLSVVGCVGLTSVGYYAVDQAIDEERARQAEANRSSRSTKKSDTYNPDPFSDYNAETYEERTYDEDGEQVGGWGDDAR